MPTIFDVKARHTGPTSRSAREELTHRAANTALESLDLPKSADLRRQPLRSLGVDSLDKLKLAIDFESHFGISIADEDIAAVKTIDQAAMLVAKAASESQPSLEDVAETTGRPCIGSPARCVTLQRIHSTVPKESVMPFQPIRLTTEPVRPSPVPAPPGQSPVPKPPPAPPATMPEPNQTPLPDPDRHPAPKSPVPADEPNRQR